MPVPFCVLAAPTLLTSPHPPCANPTVLAGPCQGPPAPGPLHRRPVPEHGSPSPCRRGSLTGPHPGLPALSFSLGLRPLTPGMVHLLIVWPVCPTSRECELGGDMAVPSPCT